MPLKDAGILVANSEKLSEHYPKLLLVWAVLVWAVLVWTVLDLTVLPWKRVLPKPPRIRDKAF